MPRFKSKDERELLLNFTRQVINVVPSVEILERN
jgi:hypothetical protein